MARAGLAWYGSGKEGAMTASTASTPWVVHAGETSGDAPGLSYTIEGELVPVLHLKLDGSLPVYFEHHILLWKDAACDIAVRKMKGAFKRVIAGMQIIMTQAEGPGEVAFS